MEGLSRRNIETRKSSQEHERLSIETREYIDRTDFKTLRNIFDEERIRAGVEPGEARFCEKERIEVTTTTNGAGEYIKDEGLIRINPQAMYALVTRGNFEQEPDPQGNLENQVRSTLVHEETHASGRNRSNEHDVIEYARAFFSRWSGPRPLGASGYQYGEARDGSREVTKFNLFNEAVTDLIAEEVYAEYQRRTGTSSLGSYRSGYITPRALLESFMVHTANATEVSRDTVWLSIKRGYFEGLDLDDTELGSVFNELALSELIADMRNLADQSEIPFLIKNLRLEKVPEESRERIKKGMNVVRERAASDLQMGGDYPDNPRIAKRAEKSEAVLGAIEDIEGRI